MKDSLFWCFKLINTILNPSHTIFNVSCNQAYLSIYFLHVFVKFRALILQFDSLSFNFSQLSFKINKFFFQLLRCWTELFAYLLLSLYLIIQHLIDPLSAGRILLKVQCKSIQVSLIISYHSRKSLIFNLHIIEFHQCSVEFVNHIKLVLLGIDEATVAFLGLSQVSLNSYVLLTVG